MKQITWTGTLWGLDITRGSTMMILKSPYETFEVGYIVVGNF